ncbi:hypothetical protein B9Z55_026990 [Caenorhabditis nigoni]|uniref:BTB domain-containing protein n=1 Tax=Caenorhabditis nigoni TaxID=1611254 RepID=A0A2G5SID4_9PELO|nr:hypothetical protein B9Z55_026990 [Caenorhabditis nigoni]
MSETPAPSIYETTFAQTNKTDAILVIDGKKLHVNKAILSYHSEYFNTLFNSDFKEKSMPEIEIKDVKLEDFATLLSLVQNNPIKCGADDAEKILELADRFQLPAVKRPMELILIDANFNENYKLKLADKYKLDGLLNHVIPLFNSKENFKTLVGNPGLFQWFATNHKLLDPLSDETKVKLFHRLIEIYPN